MCGFAFRRPPGAGRRVGVNRGAAAGGNYYGYGGTIALIGGAVHEYRALFVVGCQGVTLAASWKSAAVIWLKRWRS